MYLLHRVMCPVDLPNKTDRIAPYPVGYRISRRSVNWKNTRMAEYPMNWIPPARGLARVALAWPGLSS